MYILLKLFPCSGLLTVLKYLFCGFMGRIYLFRSLCFLLTATMLHVWNTLGTSKQTYYLIYICMTMLRHFMIKFVTKPLSSTHTHLCLLI